MSNDLTAKSIAIVGGTGELGFALAVRLASAGVPILIGSRESQRASDAAQKVLDLLPADQASVSGHSNEEATLSCETVFLTVPFAAQAATLKQISGSLAAGNILVDATSPLATAVGGRPTQPLGVWQGSAAQAAESLVPEGVSVVSALHTVSAKTLKAVEEPLDEDTLLCGNSKEAKAKIAALLQLIAGLRAIDCGSLAMAAITERLTPLLIGINVRYKAGHSGLKVTHLPDQLWAQ